VAKATKGTDGAFIFWCPGCDEAHAFPVDGSRGWKWNGSLDLPVISPSILVRSGHYVPGHEGSCWCNFDWEGREPSFHCKQCHSFIGKADGSMPGYIEFLSDCSHALAGQTVLIPDWED
jgi:Family of unknown function (DUF6527)